jgi:hypothetical protein
VSSGLSSKAKQKNPFTDTAGRGFSGIGKVPGSSQRPGRERITAGAGTWQTVKRRSAAGKIGTAYQTPTETDHRGRTSRNQADERRTEGRGTAPGIVTTTGPPCFSHREPMNQGHRPDPPRAGSGSPPPELADLEGRDPAGSGSTLRIVTRRGHLDTPRRQILLKCFFHNHVDRFPGVNGKMPKRLDKITPEPEACLLTFYVYSGARHAGDINPPLERQSM